MLTSRDLQLLTGPLGKDAQSFNASKPVALTLVVRGPLG